MSKDARSVDLHVALDPEPDFVEGLQQRLFDIVVVPLSLGGCGEEYEGYRCCVPVGGFGWMGERGLMVLNLPRKSFGGILYL